MTLQNSGEFKDSASVGFWCTVGCIGGCAVGCAAGCLVLDTPFSPVADVVVSTGSSGTSGVASEYVLEAQ